MFLVKKDGKYSYIDTLGNILIPIEYDRAYTFDASGSAIASKNGKYGSIDKYGEVKIPFIR